MKNIILFVFFIVQSLNASLYVNVGGSSSSINSGFSMSNGVSQNKPQLDLNSVVTSAVTAGILSYANSTLGTNALKENMAVSDYVKNASINGVGQGISSEIRGGEFKDGFATGAIISVVSDGALQMRKYIFDNYNYVGDGELSEGIRGDGSKVGGSHFEKVPLANGYIDKKEIIAPFGGSQTGERLIFGMSYAEGGIVDKTVEYFAGPHDFMSSWNYENIDGKTYLKSDSSLINITSGALLIPSVPFAAAPFIQNNINEINAINNIQNQEQKKVDKIMETYNQNKQLAQEIQNEN